jgi:predicted HTH transcriptional regulator
MRRIGELICKGILCSPGLRFDPTGALDRTGAAIAEPEERILAYLRRHQAASPSEVRTVLNLSRSRTYRALQHLILSGQIVANGGRTSAAAYRLADFDPSRN